MEEEWTMMAWEWVDPEGQEEGTAEEAEEEEEVFVEDGRRTE